jgi:uncharacterized protein (DUF952 family)
MRKDATVRIYHVASRAAWLAAQKSGVPYARSTRGRTLAEEGFIHAARAEQVPAVLDRFYADAPERLVVLEIDTDLLVAPWREEAVGDETYPHIFGPINASAVVSVEPVVRGDEVPSPTRNAPPLATAFHGLGFVLLASAAVLVCAAFIAEDDVDKGTLPPAVPFLVWTMFAACLMSAATSYGFAEMMRSRAKAQPGADSHRDGKPREDAGPISSATGRS